MAPRLIALIAIPTTVALVLAGARISGSVVDVLDFQRAESMITLGEKMDAVVDALQVERTRTVLYVEAPSSGKTQAALTTAQSATDTTIRTVRELDPDVSGSSQLKRAHAGAMNRLATLGALRSVTAKLPATSVITKYSEFTADLISIDDVLVENSGNTELTTGTRAWAGLARAKDAAGQENDRITAALLTGRFDNGGIAVVTAARSLRDSQLVAFRSAAPLAWRQDYDDTVTGSGLDRAEAVRQRVLAKAAESPKLKVAPLGAADVPAWLAESDTRITGMNAVQKRLIKTLGGRSRALQSDASTSAVTNAAVLLLVLLAVLATTLGVANSLVRPLRRLRAGALEVAGHGLPALVNRLRSPEAATGPIEITPIDIDTTDEIGQVARAFDEVHREAVRLAANEAVLRGDISAMFVNLSRRSQSLIERQLKLIDELEQGERDDDRLAALFRLDHLATRMRRNCENLLVLGGQDQVRRWNRPVPLVNVARASLSEVEQFERVELQLQPDISITGNVVNDLIHLLAELIENAIVFSPQHTPIIVTGSMINGGLMVQITDQGMGMTPDELAQANQRLGATPSADISAARRMGLFVVGRLAARHSIRVELRPTVTGGVTAFALLPGNTVAWTEEQPQIPIGAGARSQARALNAPAPGAPAQPGGDWSVADITGSAGGGWPGTFTDSGTGGWPVVANPDTGPNGRLTPPANTGPQPVSGWGTPPGPAQAGPGQPGPRQLGPAQTGQAQTGPIQGGPAHGGPSQGGPGYNGSAVNGSGRPGGSVWPAAPQGQAGGRPPADERRETPGRIGRPTWRTPQDAPAETQNGTPGAEITRRSEEPPPLPARPPRPAAQGSPIFDSMTSEWFTNREPTGSAPMRDPEAWTSPADEGWRQAETTTANPAADGRTSAGLPQRVPGRNRLPGSVPGAATAAPPPPVAPPAPMAPVPEQSMGGGQQAGPSTEQARAAADARRARYGGFQRGVQRGRTDVGTNQTGNETNGENT